MTLLNQQGVFINWLPPNPTNGIIIDYTVRLSSEPSGELLRTTIVSLEIVNFGSLDLTNLFYSVTVTARTIAGVGPESEPVFFGTEPISTTMEPVSTMEPTSDGTTSSEPTDPLPTPSQSTSTPLTSSTPSRSTPTPLTSSTPSQQPPETTFPAVFDDTYYIVRIVPPVVIGIFLIAMLVVTIILYVHIRNANERKRKGLYQFSEFNNASEGQEMQ